MSTRPEAALPPSEPHVSPSALREADSKDAEPQDRMTRKRSSAWDPYEVWKTRIKTPPHAS